MSELLQWDVAFSRKDCRSDQIFKWIPNDKMMK